MFSLRIKLFFFLLSLDNEVSKRMTGLKVLARPLPTNTCGSAFSTGNHPLSLPASETHTPLCNIHTCTRKHTHMNAHEHPPLPPGTHSRLQEHQDALPHRAHSLPPAPLPGFSTPTPAPPPCFRAPGVGARGANADTEHLCPHRLAVPRPLPRPLPALYLPTGS